MAFDSTQGEEEHYAKKPETDMAGIIASYGIPFFDHMEDRRDKFGK